MALAFVGSVNSLFSEQYKSEFNLTSDVESEIEPRDAGPFLESPENLFGLEKPFVKPQLAHFVRLVFSYVVKRIKIKVTAKFCASRRLSFEDAKRIMSPEMQRKNFGPRRRNTKVTFWNQTI